jgi:hypothetical protein
MGGDHLWDAVSAIGQVVGAIAVVVSIVYLAIQIRANTRAVRGQAGFEAAHSWAETNEVLGQLPDDVMRLFREAFDADAGRTEAWSEGERHRMSVLFRSLFQKLEGQYFLYVNGSLDAGLWAQRCAIARGMIRSPYMRGWWENERTIRTFSPAFAAAIDAAGDAIDVSRVAYPAGRSSTAPATTPERTS